MQAKTFTCAIGNQYSSECRISYLHSLDSIEVTMSPSSTRTTVGLTILNSTLDDIPPISLIQSSLRLNSLNCVGCGLTGIAERTFTARSLANLGSLDISSGSFSKFEQNLFSKLASLLYLYAKRGAVSAVDDDAFFNLTKLRVLDLSHNNITEITSKMFTPLVAVYQLDLSYNRIKVLDRDLFINNKNLQNLHLEHNDIGRIDGRIFNPQIVVWNLFLSYNELTALDTSHHNADKIFADHNRIERLSISTTVKGLNVEHNDIEYVTCCDEMKGNGSQITFLNMTNNSLTELGCIGSLTRLTTLELSHNNLGQLNRSSFAALTELTGLYLKSTNIGQLEYGVFSHQSKLLVLDISYNHMRSIGLEMLLAARFLRILYIDGNNLTDFSYNDIRTSFGYLQTIGIGDNDFNCTFLVEAVKHMNSKNIKATASTAHSVTVDSENINGIGCDDRKETATPPSSIVTNNNATSFMEKLSESVVENEKNLKELSEDHVAIKQQIVKMNSDMLSMKAEILKIELSSLQSSISSSDTTKINSNSDLIKIENIVLIALIVAFCVYKGYKQRLQNDVACISRDNKANTLYANIETGRNRGEWNSR